MSIGALPLGLGLLEAAVRRAGHEAVFLGLLAAGLEPWIHERVASFSQAPP